MHLPTIGAQTRDLGLITDLEAVGEGLHVRVLSLEELVAVGHNTHWPPHNSRAAIGLEAEPEVARMLIVYAESVTGSVGIGVHVSGEPPLCKDVVSGSVRNMIG